MNSTFGIAGFFDPATIWGLQRHNEDFGQSLGVWGVPPGPYLVRAHSNGFIASLGQIIDVRPSARSASSIALRHSQTPANLTSYPVAAAGFGSAIEPAPAPADTTGTTGTADSSSDDHGDIAWRLRHLRRGVLKDATVTDELFAGLPDDAADTFGASGFGNRSFGSPAHLAANFFGGTPFSGQVNLLTTGSFDTPQQFFTVDSF